MSLTIDCETCSHQNSSACNNCVVSFIVSRQPQEAVVIDVNEFAAMRRLQTAGLLPNLCHDGEIGEIVEFGEVVEFGEIIEAG